MLEFVVLWTMELHEIIIDGLESISFNVSILSFYVVNIVVNARYSLYFISKSL